MLQLTEVVSALSSMARRLSLSVPASGACISRRRPSLVTLPSFGITPRSLEQSFPLSSHSASQVQCEPRSDASDEVAPDAQCYLTSNRWSFMNERFFSERTSLELLGRGLVGEVWYEQVCSAENELVPVVTKLYDYQLPVGTLGLHVELFLYASWDHLRPLQGKYVPIIIGTFSAPGGKTALLMEPPSQAGWREASMLDTDEVKDKVIAAYAAIHAQGVLHNDVELRHILIGDEGTVQIIDWQMAKSAHPCDAVGLRACTQVDIDYEARKVKVILNYRGAYERELRLAASLYERREQGHPVETTDPRLHWFSPDEFDLLLDGYWTEPDPEYTGGRSTAAPALRRHNMDPPSAKSWQQWPKYQSGNSLLEANNNSGHCTSTTTPGVNRSVTPSSPSSSIPFFSDTSSSCTTIDQDMADNDYPPSPWSPADKKTRSQLRMISTCSRVTFLRYYNSSRKTEDADDKPPREGEASCGPKSGVLVRKPPPKTHKQLPAWEFRPAKKHHAYYFHRHTQWMHAPYESLAKSPLNNTPTRAMMPARLKASLRGSPALHVTAQFPGPQRINPLRAFGSIAPGSAPDEVKVYDQRYRNHPTDLMYYLPPPALRSRPGWDLCRVAHEIRYAMKYQDTEEMRLDMKKALSDLADEIDQTHYAIGPTPRDYQRWRETVERGRVDLAHSNKAYKLKFYSRDAQERCGIHIDDMKRLVRRARYAVRSYGPILPPASHSAGAAGYAQSNQPRTSAPVAQLSDAQRPVNTFRQLPTAHPVRFRPRTSAPHTVEQVLQAGSLTAATSSTPGPPALSPATPVSGSFTTTQSSSVPVASDSSSSPPPVSPSPKPRRERMPRIELSPRRLRSTTKVLMEPVVLALSSGAPVVARTRRVRLRVQAPKDLPAPRKPTTDASKAKRLRAAKAAASSALEQPAYIQTRYNLRVRKRKCDEESEPAPAVNNPPAPRPIKRRRN